MIDLDNFTPLTALAGGGLIGLATAILYTLIKFAVSDITLYRVAFLRA